MQKRLMAGSLPVLVLAAACSSHGASAAGRVVHSPGPTRSSNSAVTALLEPADLPATYHVAELRVTSNPCQPQAQAAQEALISNIITGTEQVSVFPSSRAAKAYFDNINHGVCPGSPTVAKSSMTRLIRGPRVGGTVVYRAGAATPSGTIASARILVKNVVIFVVVLGPIKRSTTMSALFALDRRAYAAV